MSTAFKDLSTLSLSRSSKRGVSRAFCMAVAGGVITNLGIMPLAHAKEPSRGAASLLEEVVVTARKREEGMQNVPLAVSAYGTEQLDALKIRDLSNLSVGLPNVSLDDAGTAKGYANFSIRGLGINSSILSIDPTVGIFIDGVYMGVPSGMVFDVFDLERVEVLRGPQGTLFGRNVTGGAILMTTRKPGNEPEATVRVAVDQGDQGGLNKYVMGTVGGPLSDTFGAKFTAYYNDDDGWFENQYTGDDFGAAEQEMYRLVGVWRPFDATEIIARWEHDETDSDGPAGQSHTNGSGIPGRPMNWDRESHDFSIDEEGFYTTKSDFVTLEINQGVGFGDGTITNILGWRTYDADSRGDIDSQPVWLFHSDSFTETEQISNELRYNGLFAEKANVTAGLYYFTNEIDYHERRRLLGSLVPGNVAPYVTQDGGGLYDVEAWAVFAAVDYDLTSDLTLNAGIRYSYEEKEAKIASLNRNQTVYPSTNTCNLVSPRAGERTCATDFVDDDNWEDVSPKLGLTYELSENARVYGHWTQSFRSGGYNLRNTSPRPQDYPGPFDEEKATNYEIGFKSDSGRGRFNAAVFYNQVEDMQRELNFTVGTSLVQVVRNTADADLFGVELDGVYALTDNFMLNMQVGWLDAEYTSITPEGLANGINESLELPRAPEWTYSIGLNHDLPLAEWGYISSWVSYAYRDDSAYTDNNLGYLLDQEIVDIGIDFHTNDEKLVFGIYGKNLLDDVKHGGDTQLPTYISAAPLIPLGGTFAPLSKGRIYGVQVTYNIF